MSVLTATLIAGLLSCAADPAEEHSALNEAFVDLVMYMGMYT